MNALFAALLLLQGGSSFPKPTIDHIAVTGDTVWFEGARGFDAERRRYCYVRRSGGWCRFPRATAGEGPRSRVPRSPRDSLPIGRGLTLVCRPYAEGSDECETFGVLTGDDRREHWLVPHVTLASRQSLLRAIPLETDEAPQVSGAVTAYASAEDAVWFGLGGGFPEGEGAFGGLLRYDRARRTVETVTHPGLANATVTGLAIYGGELWIGTAHPGEFGFWGSTGILRRDLRNGRWTTLDSATTPLPDNLVRTLAVAGDVVGVATRDGLAVFDPKTRRWAVRYFRRTIVTDSIVYALAVARPADEAGDEALFVLMESLGVRRREAFAAAVRTAGTERLRTLLTGEITSEDALADRTLVPFLVEALQSPRASGLAAGALARIGDRSAAPAIRTALVRATSAEAAAPLAAALARLRDSTGLAWLHRNLVAGAPSYVQRDVIVTLASIRDPSSVSPLLSVAARRGTGSELRLAAVDALRAYESPSVWRRMVESAAPEPELRPLVIEAADSVAVRDSTVARTLGDWAFELLGAGRTRDRLDGAIRLVARLRPHDAVPALVRAVVDSMSGGTAAHELVRLTGAIDAPTIDPWRGERGRRAAQEFWQTWWTANRATYRVVPHDVGERAYRAWLTRVRERERAERGGV